MEGNWCCGYLSGPIDTIAKGFSASAVTPGVVVVVISGLGAVVSGVVAT